MNHSDLNTTLQRQTRRCGHSIKMNQALIVPDVPTILNSIQHNHTCFTVVDLCSAFFSIRVHAETQPLFAFTFKGVQLTWTCLAKGFVDSPAVFSAAVKRVLNTVTDLPAIHGLCAELYRL